MTEMVLSREQQEELFELYFEASYESLLRDLRTRKSYYRKLTHERMFGVGFEQYGDKSFWLSLPELAYEKGCEIADAVVYGIGEEFQQRGFSGPVSMHASGLIMPEDWGAPRVSWESEEKCEHDWQDKGLTGTGQPHEYCPKCGMHRVLLTNVNVFAEGQNLTDVGTLTMPQAGL